MNPFKQNNQILPIASINSLYVDEILAYDVFRPAVLIEILDCNRDFLGISEDIRGEKLLYLFHDLLNSEVLSIREKAIDLANNFGDRLASVIVTLKSPSKLSMQNRQEWKEIHWEYWRNIKKLYLVGGLTSPILTKIFYKRIELALENANITDFAVSFLEGSSHIGIRGLSSVAQNGEYLLFDFGQTNIKRSHFVKKDNTVIIDSILPTIKSDYLFYKYKNEDELKQIAKLLHEYVIKTISNSIKLTGFQGNEIMISIANYVRDGNIYMKRGGYGKLAYLSDNYQKYLSQEISRKVEREIQVTLYHDTSAMALHLRSNESTAVISLGTAFGVAFID